jgi:hypothetical protein
MICEQHTTARLSLTWTLRPIIVGTHSGFAAQILQAQIRACAGCARLYAYLGVRNVAIIRETTRQWVLNMFAQLHQYSPNVLRPTV